MTVLASTIVTRARGQLIDEKATQRWSDAELLRWLSDGQRMIVTMSPSLGEATSIFKLVVGTKQTVPAGAFMLLDVKRNMGVDGLTPGRAVRVVTRELMDSFDPYWHSGARSSVTENYIHDPRQPKTFYCSPPSTGTNYLETSCAFVPPEITDIVAGVISVDDLYQTALFDYVMFRAHQKDSDYSAGEGKASVYLQLFLAAFGQYEASKLTEGPNAALGPTDLSRKGAAK